MAYVALDRFRYVQKIEAKLINAQNMLCKILEKAKLEQRDSALTNIKENLKEIKAGIGIKLFIWKGPKLFGSATKSGWDIPFIWILISILFLLLSYVTILHEKEGGGVFWVIFIFSWGAIIIPTIFIAYGKWKINHYDKLIKKVIGDSSKEYQVNINELEEKVQR